MCQLVIIYGSLSLALKRSFNNGWQFMSQLVELYEFEKVDAIKPNAMFH